MKNDSIIRGCSLHWQIGLLERNLRVHLVFCTWCAKKNETSSVLQGFTF